MTIRHLSFDLDGTLIDTRDQIVESLIACLPLERRTESVRAKLYQDADKSPKVILTKFGVNSLDEYWRQHAMLISRTRLFFSNTTKILDRLQKNNISLSLITSLRDQPAKSLIQHHDLDRFFCLVDTYASRKYRKPSPKLLAIHLEDLGVSCEDAAYVGDTARDMQMARSAGVSAWGTSWGYTSETVLLEAGANRILKSIDCLLQILR